MDWKSLTEKMHPLMEKMQPLKKKLDPLVDKAKDMGVKTLDFTQKQLQNTPLVLKTQKDLDTLMSVKRLVLITYDEKDPLSREVLLRSPVWSTKAWSDAAELQFVEKSASPDIVSSLSVTSPVDMRVWYVGEETFQSGDIAEIIDWWKTRCYDGKNEDTGTKDPQNASPELTKTGSDPLSGK